MNEAGRGRQPECLRHDPRGPLGITGSDCLRSMRRSRRSTRTSVATSLRPLPVAVPTDPGEPARGREVLIVRSGQSKSPALCPSHKHNQHWSPDDERAQPTPGPCERIDAIDVDPRAVAARRQAHCFDRIRVLAQGARVTERIREPRSLANNRDCRRMGTGLGQHLRPSRSAHAKQRSGLVPGPRSNEVLVECGGRRNETNVDHSRAARPHRTASGAANGGSLHYECRYARNEHPPAHDRSVTTSLTQDPQNGPSPRSFGEHLATLAQSMGDSPDCLRLALSRPACPYWARDGGRDRRDGQTEGRTRRLS
jgi:hypothetical protein